MRLDAAVRLLPFGLAYVAVAAVWHPRWLGAGAGDLSVQLAFGVAGCLLLLAGGAALQLLFARRRGQLVAPAGTADLALQTGYYAVNGPLEEAFFRGLVQGGIGAVAPMPVAFLVATAGYVLYHRLGKWGWRDVAATAFAGVPLGLAFWLLPGPPSILGVSIAHIGATCGFLGPGAWLIRKLRLAG